MPWNGRIYAQQYVSNINCSSLCMKYFPLYLYMMEKLGIEMIDIALFQLCFQNYRIGYNVTKHHLKHIRP